VAVVSGQVARDGRGPKAIWGISVESMRPGPEGQLQRITVHEHVRTRDGEHVPLVPSPREASVNLDGPTRENPYRALIGFLRYLREKRYELRYLDANDLWTYFTVTSLYWHKERTECRFVPLDSIKSLHPINPLRRTAVDLLEARTKSLAAYRRDIIETGRVDRVLQDTCMPSVSPINLVAEDASNYIAFEGNGRLEAIRRVVAGVPGVLVEVVVYHPTNHESCVGRLRHIRTRYGMGD